MQYYRCKCGKREYWGSGMVPAPCEGCEECNTTLETSPEHHTEPIPHDFTTVYDEHTGKSYQRCTRCFHTEGREEARKRDGEHATKS